MNDDYEARMWAALDSVNDMDTTMDQQAAACAAVAREVRADALREVLAFPVQYDERDSFEIMPLIDKRAILAMIDTPQAEAETCQDCMGTGISGHPDSGNHCYRCNGDGAVALIDNPAANDGEDVA